MLGCSDGRRPELSGVLAEEAEHGPTRGEVSGSLTVVTKESKHGKGSAGMKGQRGEERPVGERKKESKAGYS